jgi:hypothetical protein
MSALAQHPDRAARNRAAERARVAGRSRRSDAGSVTELAIALLRDARKNDRRPAVLHAGPGAGRPAIASGRPARRGARPA